MPKNCWRAIRHDLNAAGNREKRQSICKPVYLLVAVFVLSSACAKGEPSSQAPCLRSEAFIADWHRLANLDRLELVVSVHIKPPARWAIGSPNILSENDVLIYYQSGDEWRYEVTKSFNTGKTNAFIFQVSGDKYEQFDRKRRSLLIAKFDGNPNICRCWSPLFQSFSFLYEQSEYTDEIDAQVNRTTSFSPLLQDLISIAKQPDILTRLQSIVDFASGSNTSSFVVKTWRYGKHDEKIPLSEYTLTFERPDDLFPVMMEQKDPTGQLAVLYKVKEFKEFAEVRFPAITTSTTYTDGKPDKIVDARLVRLRKLDDGERIPEIDPSTASHIYDSINCIEFNPGDFK